MIPLKNISHWRTGGMNLVRSGLGGVCRSVLIGCVLSVEVQAADEPPTNERSGHRMIEEVVVTARRKEESLQDVAVSVSAMSGLKLEQAGIADLDDLQGYTPSFTITPSVFGRSTPNMMIRGQVGSDVVLTLDPAVGVYVNEVPVARATGIGSLSVLDTKSLEVLKGPQGTLFGRNTTGGALVLHSMQPEPEFTARINAGGGNFGRQRYGAMLNVPVTNWLAVRAAFEKTDSNGLIENRSGGEDWHDMDDFAWKGSLLVSVTDHLESVFFADGFTSDNAGPINALSAVNEDGTANVVTMGGMQESMERQNRADFYSSESDVDTFEKVDVFGISNTTTYEFRNGIILKSIAGYREMEVDSLVEVDGSEENVLPSAINPDVEQESVELQAQGSNFEDSLDWTIGAMYFREDGDDKQRSAVFEGLIPANLQFAVTNKSYAAYAQGTYHFTPAFRMTAGARVTEDERSLTVPEEFRGDDEEGDLNKTVDFRETTWDINLGYDINDDTMIYIARRHGYRAGGFNARADREELLEPFEPEFVDDIELGYKSEHRFWGGSLQLNLAVFVSDYRNIQRTLVVVLEDGSVTTIVENAAAATVEGGELEWTWLPTPNLDITGFVSMQKARYDEWTQPQFESTIEPLDQTINSSGLAGSVGTGLINSLTDNQFQGEKDMTGERFASVPDYMANLTVRYRLPVIPESAGDVVLQGTAFWQDDTQLTAISAPGALQKAYTLYSARLEWEAIFGTAASVALWGKNLSNEEYRRGAIGAYDSLGFTSVALGDPRTWGIDVSYSF